MADNLSSGRFQIYKYHILKFTEWQIIHSQIGPLNDRESFHRDGPRNDRFW